MALQVIPTLSLLLLASNTINSSLLMYQHIPWNIPTILQGIPAPVPASPEGQSVQLEKTQNKCLCCRASIWQPMHSCAGPWARSTAPACRQSWRCPRWRPTSAWTSAPCWGLSSTAGYPSCCCRCSWSPWCTRSSKGDAAAVHKFCCAS